MNSAADCCKPIYLVHKRYEIVTDMKMGLCCCHKDLAAGVCGQPGKVAFACLARKAAFKLCRAGAQGSSNTGESRTGAGPEAACISWAGSHLPLQAEWQEEPSLSDCEPRAASP